MNSAMIETLLRDVFWVVITGGWIFLLVTGLEADKPSSGGIPGHVTAGEDHLAEHEGLFGRMGEIAGWVVFGLTCAALPLILWWIFVVHP